MSTHPAPASRTRPILVGLGILALIALAATAAILSPRPDPASANPLTGAVAAAAGRGHTCAVTTTGGIKCWGWNARGQLGDGTTTERHTPVDVTGLTSGVSAAAGGEGHSCALTTMGGVKCWGGNSSGQLGNGTTTDSTTPVDVSGLTGGVVALAAGNSHTCAVTTAGGVKCWGRNEFGRLGDGTTTNSTTPVDVMGLSSGVAGVTAGDQHTCAITTAGGVKCWGRNFSGQLGDGTTTNRTTPVDVSGLISGVAAVAAGGTHTCAITTAGGLKCWGSNSWGKLGDGSTTQRTAPVDVVGLGSGVAAIAPGGFHTCALTTAGGAKCWGRNVAGELGDGNGGNFGASSPTPVDVQGLPGGAAAVAAGSSHTCALTNVGGLKCWGWNGFGQLGDGTTTRRTAPVNVVAELVKPLPTSTPCLPEGCPPTPTPDPSLPAMSLDAPGAVFVGVPFLLTVSANPAPDVELSGFNTEVVFDSNGLNWNQRATCEDEVQVERQDGSALRICIASVSTLLLGASHSVFSTGGAPPLGALDVAPGSTTVLVEMDFSCKTAGTFDLTLTVAPDSTFGSVYADLDGGVVAMKTTRLDFDGDTVPNKVADFITVECVDGGDVNCDAIANSLDALLILQLEAQLLSSVPCPLGGDVNGDGFINSPDALLILQFKAGLIDSLFPSPLPASLP